MTSIAVSVMKQVEVKALSSKGFCVTVWGDSFSLHRLIYACCLSLRTKQSISCYCTVEDTMTL